MVVKIHSQFSLYDTVDSGRCSVSQKYVKSMIKARDENNNVPPKSCCKITSVHSLFSSEQYIMALNVCSSRNVKKQVHIQLCYKTACRAGLLYLWNLAFNFRPANLKMHVTNCMAARIPVNKSAPNFYSWRPFLFVTVFPKYLKFSTFL
jgi:hypothetical protein